MHKNNFLLLEKYKNIETSQLCIIFHKTDQLKYLWS